MVSSMSGLTVLLLRPEDNVAVAVAPIRAHTIVSVGGRQVRAVERIEPGHKMALVPLRAGEAIRKYGQVIGFASRDIPPGAWVHEHNVSADAFDRDYAFCSERPSDPPAAEPRYFQGYLRSDGRVGTRNYIALLSTVNCSASVCRAAAARFGPEALRPYPNVDGLMVATHKSGCGIQYGGIEHDQLSRTLAGIALHPNVIDYVLVGLGCETTHADYIIKKWQLSRPDLPGHGSSWPSHRAPRAVTIQECGGTARAVERLTRMVADMLPACNDVQRSRQPASKLVLGIECGGSDSNSGITANPAAGFASDLLVAQGGTSIVGETTEIYGAEHLLTRRAKTPQIAQKLVERIKWWERYGSFLGAQINNNPSPGNKAAGLTTIYEKSLGAVCKAGTAPLSDVVNYAERVCGPGLVFMDTPGFDAISVTGMVAGGATVILFTTGLGSCSGCKPTPVIKVASNTALYERMPDDMDLNAGSVLEGTPLETVGQQVFDKMLAVASGQKTCSERHGLGDEEFAPWSIGPIF